MPDRLHKDIATKAGDALSGPHVVHYYTFASEGAMASRSDTLLGTVTLAAADVGRIARVGSSAPYAFFVLVDHATPVWKRVDPEVKNNYAPPSAPTTSDDSTQGYSRGSLWFTGANLWVCVDATPGFADWYRVAREATATPADTAAAGAVGSSGQYAKADHVHALHAHASSHVPGGTDALPPVAPLTISTDTLTLLPEHHGRTLLYTHASGCTVTVPDDLEPGHTVEHRARGGGTAKIAFVAGGTATFAQSPGCIAEIMAGGVAVTSVEPSAVCALVGELTEAP